MCGSHPSATLTRAWYVSLRASTAPEAGYLSLRYAAELQDVPLRVAHTLLGRCFALLPRELGGVCRLRYSLALWRLLAAAPVLVLRAGWGAARTNRWMYHALRPCEPKRVHRHSQRQGLLSTLSAASKETDHCILHRLLRWEAGRVAIGPELIVQLVRTCLDGHACAVEALRE